MFLIWRLCFLYGDLFSHFETSEAGYEKHLNLNYLFAYIFLPSLTVISEPSARKTDIGLASFRNPNSEE
jgi:hypothetical protein